MFSQESRKRVPVAAAAIVLLTLSAFLSARLSAQRSPVLGADESTAPAPAPAVATSFTALENAFESVADSVGKSVVTVNISRKQPELPPGMRQFQFPFPNPDNQEDFFRRMPPEFRRFFEERRRGGERGGGSLDSPQYSGSGSGFIISKEGHILTNAHVVRGADDLGVRLADGTILKAAVVGRDDIGDIAVIKVPSERSLPVARLGNSDKVRVGQFAVALGTPMGLKGTLSVGVVGGINRSLGRRSEMIQTDAHITFGNSGGPLCNLKGEVIGMNSMITREGGMMGMGDANSGFGFAIPINEARKVAEQLISKKQISRGYLGILLQELTPEKAEELKVEKGVRVAQVGKDTPGEKAGLQADDVIQSVNGSPVVSMEELQAEVRKHASGDELVLALSRKGQMLQKKAKLGELPEEPTLLLDSDEQKEKKPNPRADTPREREPETPRREEKPRAESPRTDPALWRGISVQDLDEDARKYYKLGKDEGGALVSIVEEDSPAARSGVEIGDVVKEINRQPVKSAEEFKRLVDRLEGSALVQVKRGGTARLLTIKP